MTEVEKAGFHLAEVEKRMAMQGYTGSAAGATTPAHLHEYYCYMNGDTGEMSGYASSIADHSHRITPESYARGETEASDGHVHTLMTIKEARAVLATGMKWMLGTAPAAPVAIPEPPVAASAPVGPAVVTKEGSPPAPVALTVDEMERLDRILATHGSATR